MYTLQSLFKACFVVVPDSFFNNDPSTSLHYLHQLKIVIHVCCTVHVKHNEYKRSKSRSCSLNTLF